MGFFVVIMVIAIPLLVWQVVNPRGAWKATESWKFRNPKANEPSDAAFAMSQVGGVVAIIALIVCGVMMFNVTQDVESSRKAREERADRSTAALPSYEPPSYESTDLGAGTMVGYRYPSELTLELVVMNASRQASYPGNCTTGVSVYEHSNAIIVQVTKSYGYMKSNLPWDTAEREVDAAKECADKQPEADSRKLHYPVDGRPILTAAPLISPRKVGLTLGPAAGPDPLEEVRERGVVPRLKPVKVNPKWKEVPFLADAPGNQ